MFYKTPHNLNLFDCFLMIRSMLNIFGKDCLDLKIPVCLLVDNAKVVWQPEFAVTKVHFLLCI